MKKVLIIGSSGFLGKEIYKIFKLDESYETYGTYSKTIVNGFEYLDLNNLNSITEVFIKIRPEILIITAALTNVEYCETNKKEAYKINVTGIENIVSIAKKYNSKIIYVSTEYVFDGVSGPYSEQDNTNPINYYGETKLLAEQIIQKSIKEYLIVRTTVVYGWDVNSKNFIMQLIRNLSDNKIMKVPYDQISSPTYCSNLSGMIKECCDKEILGILNLVDKDIIDRYNFAVKAAEMLNLDSSLLVPVKTEELGQIAKRPLNAGLKVDKACDALINKPSNLISNLIEIRRIYLKYKDSLYEEDFSE